MTDHGASQARIHEGDLTNDALGRLAAAMAPMAAMNAAGGARSTFRDPRELVTHGAAPAETPLEHACDSGVIRDGRAVWSRWATLPERMRATLLWVAERAGAEVRADAWSLALGHERGPAHDRATVERVGAEVARDEATVVVIRARAKGGLSVDDARAIDAATQRLAQARKALKEADGRLRAWGRAQLCAAVSAWF